jgi:hypothetical protein
MVELIVRMVVAVKIQELRLDGLLSTCLAGSFDSLNLGRDVGNMQIAGSLSIPAWESAN